MRWGEGETGWGRQARWQIIPGRGVRMTAEVAIRSYCPSPHSPQPSCWLNLAGTGPTYGQDLATACASPSASWAGVHGPYSTFAMAQ